MITEHLKPLSVPLTLVLASGMKPWRNIFLFIALLATSTMGRALAHVLIHPSVTYGFDAVGNRTSRTSSVSTISSQTATYTANDWLASDKYDSNGNTTNSGTVGYQYDVLGHLTNVNSGQILITYDGDGNRVSKKVNGVTTYYLVDDRNPSGYAQVLEEYQGTSLTRVYNYGLSLISQQLYDSSSHLLTSIAYFGTDGHGSTRFLTDTNASITDTYTFDAYGLLIPSASSGITPNNYLYCGQQWDSDLGFYYLRARYYKPDSGRFWTMDTYEGNNEDPLSLHKYLYAECDPVDMDDPSGNASSFSPSDAAAIGRQVHTLIGQDFVKQVKGGITGESVFSILGLPTGPNPFKKASQKLGRIFPDLVDVPHKEVFEIKPVSLQGTATGVLQLAAYITLFNYLDKSGGWHVGNTSGYYYSQIISLGSPPAVVVVAPPIAGMIYYTAFTPQQVGRAGAKTVAKSDSNDINQSLGISTLITIL